jgi:hypothetical protein
VIAVWEYDNRAAFERIQRAVRQDPGSAAAQAHRETLGRLFTECEEVFMASTVDTAGDMPPPGQKI